jgi:hypothetical protein
MPSAVHGLWPPDMRPPPVSSAHASGALPKRHIEHVRCGRARWLRRNKLPFEFGLRRSSTHAPPCFWNAMLIARSNAFRSRVGPDHRKLQGHVLMRAARRSQALPDRASERPRRHSLTVRGLHRRRDRFADHRSEQPRRQESDGGACKDAEPRVSPARRLRSYALPIHPPSTAKPGHKIAKKYYSRRLKSSSPANAANCGVRLVRATTI